MNDESYLLVSADGHAGPPASLYRSYLEPAYRDRFDAHQAEIEALHALTNTTDSAFSAKFQEESGDGGLLAAYDSATRLEKLDGEGVAVEVLFPDADVLGTGRIASSPFGSGLASGRDTDARAGPGRGPGPQPLARRLLRRGARPPPRRRRGAHHRRHRPRPRRDPGRTPSSASGR